MELMVRSFEELTCSQLYLLLKARVDVFVVEQQCAYAELDNCDQRAVHVWLEDEKGLAAYLRVMDRGVRHEEVSIGRVLSLRRHCGLGRRILSEGIRVAREHFGARKIYLEAQTAVRRLYEEQGFAAISEEFLEDGIPHVSMMLELLQEDGER